VIPARAAAAPFLAGGLALQVLHDQVIFRTEGRYTEAEACFRDALAQAQSPAEVATSAVALDIVPKDTGPLS
jgi:hypothetical protein